MGIQFSHFEASDSSRAASVKDAIDEQIAQNELPFALLPFQDRTTLLSIENVAKKLKSRFTYFLIIGIGGSDLGARAVHRALNHQFYNAVSDKKIFFVGDTTDPVPLEETLSQVDLKKTAVVMISKSGNTIEVMSTFLVLRAKLKEEVGHHYKDHIAVVTDPKSGILREIVNEEGFVSLPHPTVGGRFSVLSVVGLLPLMLAGVDVDKLLAGAANFLEHQKNDALSYALAQYSAMEKGRNIHVFMPYVYSLREFGFWYRQLWAESLGKALSRSGEEVHVGPTPIAALGPTDQHSQVQLYREGPDDKTFTFLSVAHVGHDRKVPDDIPDVDSVAYLKGLAFSDILKAELDGTEGSLQEVGRPTCKIELDALTAENIGGLIMFFELSTAYMGELLQIDAYNQPGVERGKELMRSRLREQV